MAIALALTGCSAYPMKRNPTLDERCWDGIHSCPRVEDPGTVWMKWQLDGCPVRAQFPDYVELALTIGGTNEIQEGK